MRKVLLLLTALSLLALAAAGCAGSGDVPAPTIKLAAKTRAVSVFYATGNTLVEERHVVADDKNVIKTTLNEVLAAKPQTNNEIAIVQPECVIRDVKVDKRGVATINFSKEVLGFDALSKEKMLAYGAFEETLKQFPEVKAFKFQVEGKERGKSDGKDIEAFWGSVSLKNQPWQLKR